MEQRNLILAIVLSLAILFGFQLLFPPPEPPTPTPAQQTEETATPQAAAPAAGVPASATAALVPRDEALGRATRVAIDSPRLTGSLSLQGGRIDDLHLRDYRETIDPGSPQVLLLSPPGAAGAYYGEFGWIASQGTNVALPGPDTVWTEIGRAHV